MLYANRVDANQKELVGLLRSHGVWVEIIEQPVDLLCNYRGVFFTVEIKNPRGRNRPTKQQLRFTEKAKASHAPHFVLREGEAISPMLDKVSRWYKEAV